MPTFPPIEFPAIAHIAGSFSLCIGIRSPLMTDSMSIAPAWTMSPSRASFEREQRVVKPPATPVLVENGCCGEQVGVVTVTDLDRSTRRLPDLTRSLFEHDPHERALTHVAQARIHRLSRGANHRRSWSRSRPLADPCTELGCPGGEGPATPYSTGAITNCGASVVLRPP